MSDFETRLRRTVQTVAEDAPAGDELWTTIEARIEVERRRRAITRFVGGALAVAAIIVAAVVTVAALQGRRSDTRSKSNIRSRTARLARRRPPRWPAFRAAGSSSEGATAGSHSSIGAGTTCAHSYRQHPAPS